MMNIIDQIKTINGSASAQVVAKAFLTGFFSTAAVIVPAACLYQGHFDAAQAIRAFGNPTFELIFWNGCLSGAIGSAWRELRPGAFDFMLSLFAKPVGSLPRLSTSTSVIESPKS